MAISLSPGVRVGFNGNPVVLVPGRDPLVVDADTHDFLLRVANEDASVPALVMDDYDTARSVQLLVDHGVLEGESADRTIRHQTYAPSLSDLYFRRDSHLLQQLFAGVAAATGRLVASTASVGSGLAMLLAASAFVIWTFPVTSTMTTVLDSPGTAIMLVFAAQAVRLLLHESGHYAVAAQCGDRPRVGLGLYVAGPSLYVNLSHLESERVSTRLRGDLAGLAVDGYLIAILTLAYLWHPHGLAAIVLLSLCTVALSSLRPTEKSDGYWALRDAMGARAVSATWATPRALLTALRAQEAAVRRFARALVAIYIAFGVVALCSLPRWLFGTYRAVIEGGPRSLAVVLLAGVAYPTMMVIALLVVRRSRASRVHPRRGRHRRHNWSR